MPWSVTCCARSLRNAKSNVHRNATRSFFSKVGSLARQIVLHSHQAIKPESRSPKISATPARCPIVASWPRVVKRKGAFCVPRMAATTFFEQRIASRNACCAVGGCDLPLLAFGIHAQSPTAQTPGRPGASSISFPTMRPFPSLRAGFVKPQAASHPLSKQATASPASRRCSVPHPGRRTR